MAGTTHLVEGARRVRRASPSVMARSTPLSAVFEHGLPQAVVVTVRRVGEVHGWVVADQDHDELASGTVRARRGTLELDLAHAPTILEAAFRAIERLLDAGTAAVLVVDAPRLHALVTGLDVVTSAVAVSAGPSHDPLVRALVERARERATQAAAAHPEQRRRRVVATDASLGTAGAHHGRRGRTTGVAWVRTDGLWGTATLETTSSAAGELAAVCAAVAAHDGRPLHVLTDSLETLATVRALVVGDAPPPAWSRATPVDRRVLRAATDRLAGADVRITWVRGHAGHALNEVADRLAVCARRSAEARIDESVAESVLRGIVSEYVLAS